MVEALRPLTKKVIFEGDHAATLIPDVNVWINFTGIDKKSPVITFFDLKNQELEITKSSQIDQAGRFEFDVNNNVRVEVQFDPSWKTATIFAHRMVGKP